MKKLALLLMGTAALWAQAQPSQLLVQPRLGADPQTVARVAASLGAPIHHTISGINVHVLRVPAPALNRVQQALEKTGLFTFVEKDQTAHVTATPNDPDFSSQWHLAKIQAPNAWNTTIGSTNFPVAVIDSGADWTHPDLAANLLTGWNFLNGTSNTQDDQGHGTATAGTIGAVTNDNLGVSSVGWSIPVMPLLAVDSTGSASYSNMASAITYAADHGIRVINMSLAGSSASSTLDSAVSYAWNKGTVVFASAGNYSTSTPYYPAASPNVVAVSSTSSSDTISSFSNYGSWIDLSAPGEGILTLVNGGGYGSWSGTSFSAPITAATAALVLSVNPSLSASSLVSLLEQNSDDLGTPGYDIYYGYGRVNAYKAVTAAGTAPVDTTPPSVSISAPVASATVSGTISVTGSATDNVGVTNVQFFVDGVLQSSSTAASYSFSWNTAAFTNASHTVTVEAFDPAGNLGKASVTVTVSNAPVVDTTPPTVTITSPANGSTLVTNTKISVSATDNISVSQVSIYIDGVLKYTGTSAPYTYTWNTKKVAKGTHTITAKAWDAAGNVGSATPVSVTK